MSALPLARRERHALCDLALALGPDAPTLCGGWDVRDMVAHLLVRENSPTGAMGITISPLSGLTDRAMERVSRQVFPAMVATLRDPGLTPYRLPVVERLANTVEYFVHHEDLRRAQPDWGPRDLRASDEDTLWSLLRGAGMLALRSADVPIVVKRSDLPDNSMTLKHGQDPVTVTGRPSELVLFAFGRHELHDIAVDGPPDAVRRLQESDRGI